MLLQQSSFSSILVTWLINPPAPGVYRTSLYYKLRNAKRVGLMLPRSSGIRVLDSSSVSREARRSLGATCSGSKQIYASSGARATKDRGHSEIRKFLRPMCLSILPFLVVRTVMSQIGPRFFEYSSRRARSSF